MNRVVHFEFAAEDPGRARAFFQRVFGWRFDDWFGGPTDYWMVSTSPDEGAGTAAPGIDGGMGRRAEMNPGIVNAIEVDDIEAALERVLSAGGEVTMGKMPIPGIGWNAYFSDTEGNLWGLYQDDPGAA